MWHFAANWSLQSPVPVNSYDSSGVHHLPLPPFCHLRDRLHGHVLPRPRQPLPDPSSAASRILSSIMPPKEKAELGSSILPSVNLCGIRGGCSSCALIGIMVGLLQCRASVTSPSWKFSLPFLLSLMRGFHRLALIDVHWQRLR